MKKPHENQVNPATDEFNSGRWSEEENNLFKKALKIYGRNWTRIQLIVQTRDTVHVRTHAQKFNNKLRKHISGVELMDDIKMEDAQIYADILRRKDQLAYLDKDLLVIYA